MVTVKQLIIKRLNLEPIVKSRSPEKYFVKAINYQNVIVDLYFVCRLSLKWID